MIIERKQGQDQRPESASMLSVGADTVSSFVIFDRREVVKMNMTLICGVVLSFILGDLVTGLLAALKNKQFKSAVMREGLFHKAGELAALGLAIICDKFAPVVNIELPVNLVVAVASYLSLMEIGSILENIRKLSPAAAAILGKFFGNNHNEGE